MGKAAKMAQIDTVETVADLRARVAAWRQEGLKVGLVPTMGALHEGHLSLVRLALEKADRVVISIFVNPTQFGPQEDFGQYPRQLEEDCALLTKEGAHLAFTPSVDEMYPLGGATMVHVSALTEKLEGEFRLGHFDGVSTVVAKLLIQCEPDLAVFGEKDYQQLCVIRQMVRDLYIPVEIIGAPIIRDEAGLALSSRNAYLSEEELATARLLNKILFSIAEEIKAYPEEVSALIDMGLQSLYEAGFDEVDYLDLRDADTLSAMETFNKPGRLLAAVRVGKTRLIDNVAVLPEEKT